MGDLGPGGTAPPKSLLTHPAFVVATLATLASEALLPLQYRSVLFRQDLEMLALSCSFLAGGLAYAAYRRARACGVCATRWVIEAAAASFATFALGALWMRFVPHDGLTGIGLPRLWVFALVVAWCSCCALAGAALGTRRSWPRWFRAPLAASLVLSAMVALAVASAELNTTPNASATGPCVQRGDVTYCHYDGYGPFVEQWQVPVEAVLAELPDEVLAGRDLLVRQGSSTWGASHLDLDAITTPELQWGGSSTARLSLALDAANTFVGINDDYKPGERNGKAAAGQGPGCAPGGDSGRMVVAWWLAGQVDDDTRRQVIEMHEKDPFQDAISGSGYVSVVGGGPTPLAAQLLERDDAKVGKLIREHWDELTSPDVGVQPIMELFDLKLVDGVGYQGEKEDPHEVPEGCPPPPRR